MVLNVIKYGDFDFGRLKLKNVDVKKENTLLQQLIDNMFETLIFYKGVGLAASQVGKNLNLFIINTPNFKEVFINPEIRLEGLSIQGKEGCLSFPSIEVPVDRKQKVKIKYYDRNWNYALREFDGILSIIIQHEYDHLKGRLILDY